MVKHGCRLNLVYYGGSIVFFGSIVPRQHCCCGRHGRRCLSLLHWLLHVPQCRRCPRSSRTIRPGKKGSCSHQRPCIRRCAGTFPHPDHHDQVKMGRSYCWPPQWTSLRLGQPCLRSNSSLGHLLLQSDYPLHFVPVEPQDT